MAQHLGRIGIVVAGKRLEELLRGLRPEVAVVLERAGGDRDAVRLAALGHQLARVVEQLVERGALAGVLPGLPESFEHRTDLVHFLASAGAARLENAISASPSAIIGRLSHCPIDSPSPSKPRKASGSRANSARKRITP